MLSAAKTGRIIYRELWCKHSQVAAVVKYIMIIFEYNGSKTYKGFKPSFYGVHGTSMCFVVL